MHEKLWKIYIYYEKMYDFSLNFMRFFCKGCLFPFLDKTIIFCIYYIVYLKISKSWLQKYIIRLLLPRSLEEEGERTTVEQKTRYIGVWALEYQIIINCGYVSKI